jgi:hypothetical protein
MRNYLFSILVLVIASSAIAHQYAWDDGTGERSYSFRGGQPILNFNRFVIQPGAETLTSIDIAWDWSPIARQSMCTLGATQTVTGSPEWASGGTCAGAGKEKDAIDKPFEGSPGPSFGRSLTFRKQHYRFCRSIL